MDTFRALRRDSSCNHNSFFKNKQNRNQVFRFRSKHTLAFRNLCSYSQRNARIASDGQCYLSLITHKKQEKAPDLNVFVESKSALTAHLVHSSPTSGSCTRHSMKAKREQHSFWCRWWWRTCEKNCSDFKIFRKLFFLLHQEYVLFFTKEPIVKQVLRQSSHFYQSFGRPILFCP